MHFLPKSLAPPDHEVIIDNPPRRQVVRQQPPGTTAADRIKDGVEDVSLAIARRSPKELRLGEQRFEKFPFAMGEAAWVGFLSWHLKLSTSSGQKSTAIISGITYFLDALLGAVLL